jgi:hypothetical protein
LDFREGVSRSYEELFESGAEADLSREANFNVKYGWYHSIWRLAKEDVTKLDEVTNMNFHKCLSALMYIKEKNVLQTQKIKKK